MRVDEKREMKSVDSVGRGRFYRSHVDVPLNKHDGLYCVGRRDIDVDGGDEAHVSRGIQVE